MHYYKKNIGDYAKKAGRLSILQHGVYNLLIDACYDREKFPTLEEAIDWVWASSGEEIEAVNFVLRKFFTLENGVYTQNRIKTEVKEYQKFRDIQAEKGRKGGRPKKTQREANGNPAGYLENPTGSQRVKKKTRNITEKSLNQEPLTTNQEPKRKSSAFALPPEVDALVWQEFEQHRKEIRKPLKELGKTKAANILKTMTHEDQAACVNYSIAGGYTGLFADRGKTNGTSGEFSKPRSAAERIRAANSRQPDGATH